jgi:hypothetical protein
VADADKLPEKTPAEVARESHKAKVDAWLNEKCPTLRCSACGKDSFGLPPLGIIPEVTGMPMWLGGGMPVMSLVCVECGHIELFSAMVMGLFPQKQEEKK